MARTFSAWIVMLFPLLQLSQQLVVSDCPIAGASIIRVGGPLTLNSTKYADYGSYLLNGALMFQHWLHYERNPPGIVFGGNTYCVELIFEDDYSTAQEVEWITQNMTTNGTVDFFLAPYSSTLTGKTLAITDPAGYIVLAAGAASEGVFSQYQYGYAIQPPSKQEFDSILKALYYKDARTVAYMHENAAYPNESCKAIDGIVELIGSDLEVVGSYLLSESPTYEEVEATMTQVYQLEDVDILVACVYLNTCFHVTEAMMTLPVEPDAHIMSVCATMEAYVDVLGPDAQYLLSNVPWSTLMSYEDEISLWNTQDFVANYSNRFDSTPTHHAAGQFVMLEVLTTVIERAESIESGAIAFELARVNLDTLYGPVEFSSTNMNKLDTAYVQIDETVNIQLVIPEIVATAAVIYPMVSWTQRDCISEYGNLSCECSSECADCSYALAVSQVGECSSVTMKRLVEYSWPSTCKVGDKPPPGDEEIGCGFIPTDSGLGVSLITLSTILSLMSFGCGLWILKYRKSKIILANQPLFLILFCLGCSILSIDTATFVGRPNVPLCVSRFSLLMYGFTLMFGTLLILVYRVWRIFSNEKMLKVRVREKDVLQVLVMMLCVDAGIMVLMLTIFVPEVNKDTGDLSRDISCSYSSAKVPFVVIYKVAQLLAGCYLSYKTRNVDKRFLQSNLIMIAVFNMSLLWLCFLIASQLQLDEVSSSIISIFTILGSCVTGMAFVIVPKIYMHFNETEKQLEERMSKHARGDVSTGNKAYKNTNSSNNSKGTSTGNDNDMMFSAVDFARLSTRAAELMTILKAIDDEIAVLKQENAVLQQRFDKEFSNMIPKSSIAEFTKRLSINS